jgi:hypothetical protein
MFCKYRPLIDAFFKEKTGFKLNKKSRCFFLSKTPQFGLSFNHQNSIIEVKTASGNLPLLPQNELRL